MARGRRDEEGSDPGAEETGRRPNPEVDKQALRRQAEEYLRNRRPRASALTPSDLATLVSELEIHQAELEVQNEELRRVQVELTDTRNRYRDLYEFAPIGYLSLDSKGVIRQVNLAACALCGQDRGTMLGARIEEVMAREAREAHGAREARAISDHIYLALQASADERAQKTIELRIWVRGAKDIWLSVQITADPETVGLQGGFLMTLMDITARKRAEEEMKRLNERLEARIVERTKELEQLVGSLTSEVLQRQGAESALMEANRQLATRAAQLRALAGELTLAEQRERRRLAKVLHDHLQQILVAGKYRIAVLGRARGHVIQDAAREIEHLLDQCIATSRSLTAELSPPILQEAGLPAALEWLSRWMADRHDLKVILSFEEGIPSLAEDIKVLLFESVRELLFNAVKHAHVSEAAVDLRTIENRMLQVTVSDRGRGFDKEKVKAAGEPGGGFGLFGIRERLDMFGGMMEIDSALGRGSWIKLKVPMGAPLSVPEPAVKTEALPGSKRRARTAASAEGEPIRVMLADDHVIMRQGLSRLLGEETDMEIVGEAADGMEAVELAGRLHPDVILMDLSMPRLNGVEATRTIHSDYPEICIIGLSMFEETERAQAMREAGASEYLAKTGPSRDLIAAIRSCMTRPTED